MPVLFFTVLGDGSRAVCILPVGVVLYLAGVYAFLCERVLGFTKFRSIKQNKNLGCYTYSMIAI